MTTALDHPTPRRVLPSGGATALQATILITFLAASSAPSPVYDLYRVHWDLAASTLTIVFAVYALSLLAALLVAGRVSDHLGRRPTVWISLGLVSASMVVFLIADAPGWLIVARVVQGLATGIATAALTAGVLDTTRTRGGVVNSVAPIIGMAFGALGSSLLVQAAPAPMRLVFLVLLILFVLQAVALIWLPETSLRRPGALRSLRPRIRLPAATRPVLPVVVPISIAAWALGGFHLSLGPSLAQTVTGSDSALPGGLLVFALTAAGAGSVLLLASISPHRAVVVGAAALAVGVLLTLLSVYGGQSWLFYLASITAGVGFGTGFQGALRMLVPLASPQERTGLMSTFYIVCYLGNSVPTILAGVLADSQGVVTAAAVHGAALIGLAALTLMGALRTRA
ncbi:MFS family permease [Actinoalloteichus hoggarensis]|uniref:Multidrug efflux system protein MdtL n=1 Tax=Actinoalloteichus hoggarensis TaxID=1470176 RepID=A0A221W5K1_9PSEU|nr:MFS transporter [Actinoalloteichus hoggarensis]ASO21222.1 multidrug efflux system protein MdtL [Actinoalloteichus hoggarensis]MBB5921152.1 MFS family permease [Actinoalloteichus hoggarensis]